jgi:hypothetical protein
MPEFWHKSGYSWYVKTLSLHWLWTCISSIPYRFPQTSKSFRQKSKMVTFLTERKNVPQSISNIRTNLSQIKNRSQQFLKWINRPQAINGLLKTFYFTLLNILLFSTSCSSCFSLLLIYVMKIQTPSLFLWKEMKEETITRYFWSHLAPESVYSRGMFGNVCGSLLSSSR